MTSLFVPMQPHSFSTVYFTCYNVRMLPKCPISMQDILSKLQWTYWNSSCSRPN